MVDNQFPIDPCIAVETVPFRMETPDDTGAGEEYTLSDLEMVSPDTLVASFPVYELRAGHGFQLVANSLNHGLSQAAEQLPPLAAKIHFDSSRKPLKRMTRGSLSFQVRKFDVGEHKSFAELAERWYLPCDLDRLQLLPEEAFANTNKKHLFLAQLSLIPGGLILALGFRTA